MLFDDIELPTVEIEPIEPQDVTVSFSKIPKVDRQHIRAQRAEILTRVDEDGFLVESGVRLGQPVLLTDSVSANNWAILLTTLANRSEVEMFRQSLQEQGIESFVTSRKEQGRIVIDVVNGPYSSRETLEQAARRFTEQLGYEVTLKTFTL